MPNESLGDSGVLKTVTLGVTDGSAPDGEEHHQPDAVAILCTGATAPYELSGRRGRKLSNAVPE